MRPRDPQGRAERRALGGTSIDVSPVALGCWPISGMTTPGVTDAESVRTIHECLDLGINLLDTAYAYGQRGESDRRIAAALGSRRDEMVIASKVGLSWDAQGNRAIDGRAATLKRQCEESLDRLNTDRIDLLYLHAADPNTPLEESADALRALKDEGKARALGFSNCTLEQLRIFHTVCPATAVQVPYNMLMRGIEADLLPWCRRHGTSVMVYWPLMKGLLAGRLSA